MSDESGYGYDKKRDKKEIMNILELEYSLGWGGQEKRTVRLINNLSDEFKVFYIVRPNSKLYKKRDEIKAKVIPVEINPIYNLKTIFFLVGFIKENDIKIISTHSGKDAWLGNILGILTKAKVVRTRHLLTPNKKPTSYNFSDKVVCVSKEVENYLKKLGVKREKLTTIHTGVDTEKFKPNDKKKLRKEYGISDDTIVIGIVAVLRNAKRHIDLIEAFSSLEDIKKDIRLVIVGEGPQEKNIKKFIKEKFLEDKVIMTGHREDIDEILSDFDIFCLPSNMEALGTSILEASSCGVPVVASRVGGIKECVKEEENGLLFEPMNVKELRERLKKLITDENLRSFYKKNARIFIEKNFSTERMVKLTQNLYKEIIL